MRMARTITDAGFSAERSDRAAGVEPARSSLLFSGHGVQVSIMAAASARRRAA